MKSVRFNIYRKIAFAGALLPYNIYINGQFVGTIKNGKALSVEVPKSEVYYLEDNNSFEKNAIIYDNNSLEYNILLKRAGGWRTDSYNKFYIDNGRHIAQLPSFHFEKFMNAILNSSIEQLSPEEQLLALCMEFWNSIMDDIEEVLTSSNLNNIIEALQTIGANRYANLLLNIIKEYFSDVRLPLNDEQIEQMYDPINKANQLIWLNEAPAWDELRIVVIHHITNKLNNTNNVY
ncbi:MAG: hypothetical protein ACI4II_07760 [Acutalibacteraceae bacterium]